MDKIISSINFYKNLIIKRIKVPQLTNNAEGIPTGQCPITFLHKTDQKDSAAG